MRTASALLVSALLLGGCNGYKIFDVAGFEQTSFSNKADILFIADDSSSMADEAAALALNFDTFIKTLTNDQGTPPTDNLSNAVDNYVSYVTDRGRALDYQLAITTTSVQYTDGTTSDVDPGEAGLLLGDPTVISNSYNGVADAFTYNLLCEATCWSTSALSDVPAYTCGEDPGGVISTQYLDCLCGAAAWQGHCGSGTEEHLEATLLAMCRATDPPPDICYDSLSPFSVADINSNPGMLRPGATTVVVIVSDEGDSSRRLENGEASAQTYLDDYDAFENPIRFAVVGPDYDATAKSFPCNSGGATSWGTLRLQEVVAQTEGFYHTIEEGTDPSCTTSDFSVHLTKLGELLNTLLNVFQLQSIPDDSTIRAYVNDVEIDPSPETTDATTGAITYGDGWSYDTSQNAVVFHGSAVPDYNAAVRIYYLPLDGKPRDLPF